MGINLPTSTKLSDDALEKRLREGLNASQNRENIPAPLNINSIRPWPMLKPWAASASSSAQGRPVFDAVRRTSVQEMAEHAQALRAGQRYDPSPLYTNAFMDIRQTMMSIGHALDKGQRWCIVQDTKCETYALNIRVRVSVRVCLRSDGAEVDCLRLAHTRPFGAVWTTSSVGCSSDKASK